MDTSFSVTLRRKRVLVVNGYIYQKNKEYRPRNSDSPVIYWHCERKRDINCKACVHTDVGASNINLVNDSHNHDKIKMRTDVLLVAQFVVQKCMILYVQAYILHCRKLVSTQFNMNTLYAFQFVRHIFRQFTFRRIIFQTDTLLDGGLVRRTDFLDGIFVRRN